MSSCRVPRSTLFLSISLALLALQPPVSQAQLQLANVNISRAVEILAERFRQLANDGLGVDALKENYQMASYSYSSLSLNYVEQLLLNSSFSESINEVLTLFDNIASGSAPGDPVNLVDCCPSSSGPACCYSCQSSSASSTLSSIAGAYASSNLSDNATLLFAAPNGALMSHPPYSKCEGVGRDGRLESWFTDVTRENPVEVVIVLDVLRNMFISNESLYDELINGVTTVLSSLNNGDRVALVGVDDTPVIPRASIFSQTETIPFCPEAVLEMEAFMMSFTPSRANHNAAFETAFDLFSDDNTTDKLLLFFTSGFGVFTIGEDSLTASVARLKNTANNPVSISAFRLFDDAAPFTNMSFNNITAPDGIVETLSDGTSLSGPLSSLVAGYYPLSSRALTPSSDVVYSHAISRTGGALSITRPYFNGSTLMGVFRALLPWEQLLGHVFSALAERPSSYPFVTDSDRRVLYHPLIPSDGDESVLITDLEIENPGGLIQDLDRLSDPTTPIQFDRLTKTLLRHTGSEDDNAFFPYNSTSQFTCHRVNLNNDDFLNFCIVLAEVDMFVAKLNPINPSAISGGGFSPPVYHNLNLSVGQEQICNYFCKRSLNDQLSFQLTGSRVPADSESFVNELTNFITGERATPPEGVESLVATEIALASKSVASRWTNSSSAPSGYLTRRHLATSSGVYLSYPAIQLNRNFFPSRTEWYQASVARSDLLTLTPPRGGRDSLNETGRYTISAAYAVRAPTAPSQQGSNPEPSGTTGPVAVVAGDLTLSSVRSFLREAVPGCEEDSTTSCLIVDDMLNLVYDRETFKNPSNSPRFLGRTQDNTEDIHRQVYQGVLSDLVRRVSLTSSLIKKKQCVDYYSSDIETRRFYQLDTSLDNIFLNTPDRRLCVDYKLQHIRGTNAFLLIVKRKFDCSGSLLCFCSANECQNCREFNDEFCECPCVCSDDCQRNPEPIPNQGETMQPVPACPAINRMHNLGVAESSRIADSDSDNQLLEPPFCFTQECNCRGQDSCLLSRECSWCEAEGKCVHVTDCCTRDDSGVCCGQPPQQERFTNYGACKNMFTNICRHEPGAFDGTCPTVASSQTSLIIAVVVGCTFGLILVAFLVIFIIWYQFFRRADVAEETSRESAFDFSKKRMESTNPMANSTPDVKSDDGNDVGNVTKSKSPPTSPHPPPNEEPEKTDLNEKSNGKDETIL